MFLTYLTPNQDQRDCEEVQRPKHHPCTIPRGGQVDKQHVPNIFPIHIILYMFQICFLDISDDFLILDFSACVKGRTSHQRMRCGDLPLFSC